ncbi:MAG: mechanosensitive ion channel domain-containing protein [Bacteroidota bacterium]
MEILLEHARSFLDAAIQYTPTILLALAILVVGFWLVKRVSKIFELTLNRANFAPEITSFLSSIFDVALKVFILLIVAGVLGFELTALVGILAAAGFAVGMALQGSLGNFAAGITIMVFKPYRVGDWVEIQDKFGKVESIQIFNTNIVTPGRKVLIIPNGQVVDGVITNFSTKDYIRLELNVTMPYEESYPKVKSIILSALAPMDKILTDPEIEIGIESYDSHNIILAVRPFIQPENYWDVTFEAHQRIKEAFNQNNIKVAYSEGVELGPIGN